MEYKQINYDEFCAKFVGWNILEDKHFHDLAERKYYNEYTIQSPTGTKIILIISYYYHKKRVQTHIYHNNIYVNKYASIGTKQIKQILEPNTDLNLIKYLIQIDFDENILSHYIKNKDPLFNEDILRRFIDFFYN